MQQGCWLSPCFFNIYTEQIVRNARLDELQAGNQDWQENLRYMSHTTLMAESKEELKILLMRMKEEGEKAGLKLNVKNNNNN